ncbi:aminotransferase-like domain-containing protein [Saccharomonospora xinjiangensis]|uniref:Transcriptional regulator with HTH domain and aminotransferase domain n=1 Tax=Saccharomonospora xinjiangensis XJ-54 TaxID=882086 RepID=I0UYX6_9PSEU|nr:PLP-dependent aminotransferase family protein [Saccharomonospora xinjiangensis]EID53079.1 transcriptional regulator with HTH domain and aminotransferase domain [Saccharomonospora xinjiangensis XJ-54]
MSDYRSLADAVAADIVAGRLRPGERLPTQRRFARVHGIAISTAGRVYQELTRRGLVVGEVGRGTYVRAARTRPEPALAEPSQAGVDLELNISLPPGLPESLDELRPGFDRLLRADVLAEALRPTGTAGTPAARAAATTVLARAGWTPDPATVSFAGNGRQAIAAAVSALVDVGGTLGVESLTYPAVKGIAARLGVMLVPLPCDEHGLLPGAVRDARPDALYVQPTLHNPLGVTMPESRRLELAGVLRELDIAVVEDTIYAFLREEVPLAAYAPERTVLVDSLSKRFSPGLTLGFLVTPAGLDGRVAAALRSGGWAPPGFTLVATTHWMEDGTVAEVQQRKRADAVRRSEIVRRALDGFDVRGDPRAYHCWWELPQPWRADTFVAAAVRRGIAVSPSGAFAVGRSHAPSAVRLAIAGPDPSTLESAVRVLASLARATPEDERVE